MLDRELGRRQGKGVDYVVVGQKDGSSEGNGTVASTVLARHDGMGEKSSEK